MNENTEFHSGKRLAIARELKGWTQENLVDGKGLSITDTRSASRWETKGIAKKEIADVAKLFGVDVWAFKYPSITTDDFEAIILNPSVLESIQKKYEPKPEGVEVESSLMATNSVQPTSQTNLLIFKTKIGGRVVEIMEPDFVAEALTSRAPINPEGYTIDLNDFHDNGTQENWQQAMTKIDEEWESFSEKLNGEKIQHISLFGLAPIPLLYYMGSRISDTRKVDLFQHDRESESWRWKEGDGSAQFQTEKATKNKKAANVALILSISGKIERPTVAKALKEQGVARFATYEIEAPAPSRTFLQHKNQLEKFRKTYSELLEAIKREHGLQCNIHLFPAIPAPFAIACGRIILPKVDPTVHIYDFDFQKGGFRFTIEV